MKKFLTLSLLGVALTSAPAYGALLLWDDAASFNSSAVVGGTATATEAFNSAVSSLFTYTNNGGYSTISGSATPNTLQMRVVNGVSTETLNTIAGAAVTGGTLTNGNVSAWGANFDTSAGGFGQGLTLVVNFVGGGSTTISNINLRNPTTPGVFFFGVTSDTTQIASITIQASTQNLPDAVGELFTVDNIAIKAAVTAGGGGGGGGGVPEPSTFGLMGLAMVGLGLVRRFRA